MFEDSAMDIRDLQIRLSPAVGALFEPVSGIMVMNITDDEFDAMRQGRDAQLEEEFAHEMYHCFQVYATGYQFRSVGQLRDVLLKEYLEKQSLTQASRRLVAHYWGKLYMKLALCVPKRYRFYAKARYLAKVGLQDRAEIQQLFGSGQASVVGARFPALYNSLTKAKQQRLAAGRDGLSANDLLECSAAVYARMSLETSPANTTQILEYLDGLAETYSRALRKAVEICGERAKDIILPTVALALRYERPENAFCELARRVAESAPGEEIASAKKLAPALPPIEGAGEILGTAVESRYKIGRRFDVYAEQMDALTSNSWGIDELDLLTKPDAIRAIPPGSLGFGIKTLDGARGPREGVFIAAIMLRGGPSVYQAKTEVDESLKDLAADLLISSGVAAALFSDDSAPDTGVQSLEMRDGRCETSRGRNNHYPEQPQCPTKDGG